MADSAQILLFLAAAYEVELCMVGRETWWNGRWAVAVLGTMLVVHGSWLSSRTIRRRHPVWNRSDQ